MSERYGMTFFTSRKSQLSNTLMFGCASMRSNIRVYPCNGMAWYVSEVPIVAIGSHRDARGHLRLQLGRIEPPLLARVVLEEFLVQLAADLADDDVFRGLHALAPLGALGEELCQLL